MQNVFLGLILAYTFGVGFCLVLNASKLWSHRSIFSAGPSETQLYFPSHDETPCIGCYNECNNCKEFQNHEG